MTEKIEFENEIYAIDALDNFYGPTLINYSEVNFVGIIKNSRNLYEIKIGKNDGQPLNIKIPTDNYKNSDNKTLRNIELIEKFNYNDEFYMTKIETVKTDQFIVGQKANIGDKNLLMEKPSELLMGGINIGNKEVYGGTLGAIFCLEGFPNEFFGISNWHILGYKTQLGDPIYQPGIPHLRKDSPASYECGNLFWKCLDDEREVAFVRFNHIRSKNISPVNFCGYKLSGNTNHAAFGEKTRKCGIGTLSNLYSKNSDKKEVYSNRAFVKVFDNSMTTNSVQSTVFKNQILVKNFTEDGDSGAVLINENNDVIGLIMAETKCSNYTVANNINNIFGIELPDAVISIKGTRKFINQFNLLKFV